MRNALLVIALVGVSIADSQTSATGELKIVATPTQAIISYTAPATDPCTIQEGTDSSFATVDHDVDPVLFPGSNQDTTRPGSVINGMERTMVVGFRGTATASDGKIYSRALENATMHHVRITCSGKVFSADFETQNPPMGNTAPDYLPFNPSGFGNYGWPTINYTAPTSNAAANLLIDPLTGYQLQRWTGPGDGGDLLTGWGAWTGVIDLAGSWTTPQNILSSNGYASYSGAGGPSNALYLWAASGLYRPTFINGEYFAMDDLQVQLTGHATAAGATQTMCLVYDAGAGSGASDCLGKQITTAIPRKNAMNHTPSGAWPEPILGGWGSPDVTNDMLSNTFGGTLASVSGNAVTWGANSNTGQNVYFPVTVLKPGMRIGIAGTDPACPKNICTIASVEDEQHLSTVKSNSTWKPLFTTTTAAVAAGAKTIPVSATNGFLLDPWMNGGDYYPLTIDSGTNAEEVSCKKIRGNSLDECSDVKKAHASGAPIGENRYEFPNFGIKLWVNPNGGTVFLQNAQNNWAMSNQFSTEYQGAGTTGCDGKNHPVTYAADGVTPLRTPTTGYYCTFVDEFANNYFYLMIPSTGESRKLSNLNNGAKLGYAYDTSRGFIENCVYNDNLKDPTHQRYAAWNDNRGNNNIQNPAITCSYVQEKQTVQQEIAATYPQIDFAYFGRPALQHAAYPFFKFMMRPQQGAMTWFCDLDVSQPIGPGQVQYCHNSWETYPSRWAGVHGFEYWMLSPRAGNYAGGWSNEYSIGNPRNPGVTAFEQWDVQISKIYNNGESTGLSSSFTDPKTCAELGVTDERWVAQGAKGNNCVQMDVLDPVSTTAGSQDLRPLGSFPVGSKPGAWRHNGASCGGDGTTSHCWSYLQPIAPGDNLMDYSDKGREVLGVGAVTPISGNPNATEHVVLWRKYNPFGDCAGSGQDHAAGFTLSEILPGLCGGTGFILYPDGDIGKGKIDNPSLNGGHIIQWPLPGTQTFILSAPSAWNFPPDKGGYGAGYAVRIGKVPEIWGQGANYGVQDYFPFDHSYKGLNIGIIQSHAGGLTYDCPTCKWILDGRPLGGAGGGVNTLWKHSYTKVAGTQNIYMLDLPEGQNTSLDLKRQVVRMWAGQHLIQNISGPKSHLDDSTPWQGCIALFAGECVSGSQPNQIYEVVPQATTSMGCQIDLTINTPCVAPMGLEVAGYTQHDISASDPEGLRGRLLTYAFNGPGRTNNYANMHALSTGDWGVTAVAWGDGRRGDVWGVRLPPIPAADGTNRTTWIPIPITQPAVAGSTVRIRYGYSEYGLDSNHQPLFCNPNRLEDCTTASSSSSGVLANKFTNGSTTNSTTSSALGTEIGVTASSLSVKSLGRECLTGNSHTHTLQLLDLSLKVLASVKVNMAGCKPSQFVSGKLDPIVTLRSGQYYLMSSETSGGDSFYSQASTVTPTNSQVSVLGAIYDYQGSYGSAGGNGTAYGPLTMSYDASSDAFAWSSEPQSWTPCNAACTIKINAYSGRVLYYVIDRMVNGVVTSSGLNVVAVP